MSFPINQQDILDRTDGGLDIMKKYFEIKDVRKHFKIRKESTESANLHKTDKGVYLVRDWGDVGGFFSKAQNAISVYGYYEGLTYFESLLQLGKELGLLDENKVSAKNITSCKFFEFEGELNEDGFSYETKEFTDYELETLGPLVTKEVCKKYNLYSLKSYSWIKSDELKQKEMCDVYTVTSSETYPILAFITKHTVKPKLSLEGEEKTVKVQGEKVEKTWLKIYQPKAKDKKYRFSHLGSKPKDYIFGLDNLIETGKPKIETSFDPDTNEKVENEIPNKVPRVVICSGDRDAINMASTGVTVIWFNSETANVTDVQIKMFYKYAQKIINVPDLDPTGVDAGKKLALRFLDICTGWLPDYITKEKDFRGNPLKDFTDYVKLIAKGSNDVKKDVNDKVKRFLELARPGKFWSENYSKNGGKTYKINYKDAFNFLKLNGFYRVKDEHRKDGFYFVQQDKHVLREVSSQEIKDFFIRFLDQKQEEEGLTFYPDELLNMIIASEAMSDKKLNNLPVKEFDLTDFTPTEQFFFFDKFIWKVSKDGIEEINKGYSRYVMENDILNNIIKKQTRVNLDSSKIKIISEPFFTVGYDKNNNYDLTIHRKDCDFLNYFISTSRVHWKDELKGLKNFDIQDYLNENKFIIDKSSLTDEQIYEQEVHFINKCYGYGYMLHRYKDPSKAWVFYCMDNEVVDDSESHGRTGKSVLSNLALRLFMNSKYMGARKKGLLESDFLYDGVTEATDYILFDDADKKFPFQQLFTDVTGDLNVNPKNQNAYLIPFHLSPKIAITTNYAPIGLDTSTGERILFSGFGNWYHGEMEDFPKREPKDDFGTLFFTGWDDHQWNLFLNFSMQCLQLFLRTKEKIGAPSSNIKKRNLISEMGPIFHEWAEEYFQESILNKMILKKHAFESLLAYNKSVSNTSATLFKKKLKQFCEFKGYKFCPDMEGEKKCAQGRFMRNHESKVEEFIYIQAKASSDENDNFNSTSLI